jgi:signal transduction histidine kinase
MSADPSNNPLTNPLANALVLEGGPAFLAPTAETREKLLAAAARASRLLLESTDAMKAMPDVLRLLGEAAEVHRTALALAEVDAGGERWLVIKDEWISEELMEACPGDTCAIEPDQYSDIYCSMLQTGKSVLYCRDTMPEREAVSITSDRARSSAIVPILVDGEYVGVIGFDDWRRARQFDSSIVSALEIAAGLVGAALYRERLLETMRRERERAAEERLTQLDRANATLRANLNRLAGNPDVKDFISNMLMDASRQLDAAACYAAGRDLETGQWRIFLYMEEGRVGDPPFPQIVPSGNPGLADLLENSHEPVFFELEKLERPLWPEATEWHQRSGHKTAYLLPLVFGERNVGFLTLVFRQREPLTPERMQVVLALAHQATLAIGMKRLGIAAKEAAVLAERNRIGQEIHDGLAQGFTGILMQLGAAEEEMVGCAKHSPLPDILKRIRDLAKDGLAEARRSVLALRPDQTRRVGLELALRQLAERSHMPGRMNFSFEGGMTGDGLAPERQHELLRIAQEAVSNAVRHAHPTNIRIVLREEETRWELAVIDDGRGMTLMPELYASQGFGLTNMRERAGAIGGTFTIDSKAGVGTRVIVSLPRPAGRLA